jgi:hypothetical protein
MRLFYALRANDAQETRIKQGQLVLRIAGSVYCSLQAVTQEHGSYFGINMNMATAVRQAQCDIGLAPSPSRGITKRSMYILWRREGDASGGVVLVGLDQSTIQSRTYWASPHRRQRPENAAMFWACTVHVVETWSIASPSLHWKRVLPAFSYVLHVPVYWVIITCYDLMNSGNYIPENCSEVVYVLVDWEMCTYLNCRSWQGRRLRNNIRKD